MRRSLRHVLSVGVLTLFAATLVFWGWPRASGITVTVLADESPPAAQSQQRLVEPTSQTKQLVTGYGTLAGQIVLDGPPPVIPPLVAKDEQRKDPECCRLEIPDESFLVDPKTSGIRNVFVYLPKAAVVHPDLRKSTQREVEVRAENCRYVPHAIIARTDQVVMFKVDDKCGHSAHAYPLKSASYCAAISLGSPTVPLTYKVAEREPFPVTCDVHPWMKARWLILDHPYSALTDQAGKFRIEQLPAGEHKFVVWQESAGFINKELTVTIKADETTNLGALKVPLEKFKC